LSMSIIITDLTKQKETEQLLKLNNKQLKEAQEIARQLNTNLENKVKERTHELETSVSEKTVLTEELRKNQERLTLILETMAEGVSIVDLDGRVTYANPMAQKILGMQKNELSSRLYNDPKWTNLRLDGTLLPKEEHPMMIMLATGKPVYDCEIGIQQPGKETFYISVNGAPIRDGNGTIIGGVGTFMDVTNRRKSIQQRDEFISVASHELKTPMTTLKASLQILERMIATEKESPMLPLFLAKASTSLVKLSGLTDDLLNVSRLEKGQLVLNKASFNVYEMVKENAENLQFVNQNMEAITINGDRDICVIADRYRIEQVLDNLLTNAIKYSPSSSRIHITIERFEPDSVKVSVQDFGIGIPEEKQQQLFNRYYRVDYSSNQYSGLGLGLYISNGIILKHDGTMGVHSRAAQGSTFWFTLPIS
ncbi:MAG: ATP-binding protein, partial [Bacteroidota bacterium]|nr:ATP-binding protein [Bacteroidota bacterium]